MTHKLVLLRHGESEWNAKNLFTGWVDVPLNDKGRAEGIRAGELIRDAGVLPDVVHTSLLRRAINTAAAALDVADRHWIPVKRSWRLNERHYGALQGKNKKETLEAYGEEQSLTAIAGAEGAVVEAAEFGPVAVEPGGFVNLAEPAAEIVLTGDFEAGDFVPLTVDFGNGERISMNVPVVPDTDDAYWEGLDVS